jgi:2-polyprenyl-3-methyl-5-hydroxy-6-metoxy-1,4-benzoquinol methylase
MAPDRFHGRTMPFQLVCCPTCSLVWLADPPKTEEMALHYSQEYDRRIAAAGDNSPGRWRDRKQTLTQYKRSGALLDLGCSAGSFLKALQSKEWELYGIDMSIESARRAQAESGAKVFVGDILDAPFRASSFDAITCFHVFEHLYKPQEVLSKVSDWLKPGGIFYVLVPNIDSAGAHIFRSYWYALELPRHVFHYSPKSLSMMARSVGLEVVSLTTHREVFIEQSTRYIIDDMLRRMGIRRVPLANTTAPSIMFRLVRKAFRLTILQLLTGLASLAGDGESIHAVFKKSSN